GGRRRPRCHGSEDPRFAHRQVRRRAGRLGDSRHGGRGARRYAGGRVRALSADGRLPGTHAARARRHPARVRAPGPQDACRVPGIAALMAAPGEKRSFAQDFFFELMRDSQRVRAVYLAERERWVRSLEISGREEILFELEMLLRGLDRFFNLRNLFGDLQPPPERDWKEELKAARDALHLLDDEKKRRAFALGLLASFRALRSLRYVPSPPAAHTRRVLVILALVRSELHALVGYLESDLPRLYPGAGAPVAAGKAA